MDQKEQEKLYVQYLKQGVLLLSMKEFEKFHFDLTTSQLEIKNLKDQLVKGSLTTDKYNSETRQLAMKILLKEFSNDKVAELHHIFSAIIKKYPDNQEIQKTALASKMFLEDPSTKKNHMPVAIARLLEDISKL